MSELLNIRRLKVSMLNGDKRFNVLNNVSLKIEKGEIRAIVGESGCGKSTLANSIIHLLPIGARIEEGSIILDGKDLTTLSENEMRNVRSRDLGIVFQDPFSALDPVFTIYQQFHETMNIAYRTSKKQSYEKAKQALISCGIANPEEILSRYPHELSGGLRQRVMIAMALLNDPKLLIADEPTTALDVTIQQEILKLLRTLAKERGMSVLFITHSLDVAAEIADKISVFYGGRIAEEGEVSEVFHYPIHPYTQALLKTIPSIDYGKDENRLMPIEGELFSFLDQSLGCPFAPRCPYAKDECKAKYPELRQVGSHSYNCIMEARF